MFEGSAAVVVRGLCVERGRREVIAGLDLEIRQGESLAVLGPNGAGKSTLLRALCGLLPHSGDIALAAYMLETAPSAVAFADASVRALSSLNARQRARAISFVPQSPALSAPLLVRDVVAQGRYVHTSGLGRLSLRDRAVVEEALRQVGAIALADRAFNNLSRGQQQLVMLARALATEARILCLDEPTASLDVAHALEVYALLGRLRHEGYALVVALHPLADALRFADRALLLAGDGTFRCGAVGEVLRHEHVREVYGVEMRSAAAPEFHLPKKTEEAP